MQLSLRLYVILRVFSTLDQDNIPLVYSSNALVLTEILEFLRKRKFSGNWVQASSAQVYGEQQSQPIDETAQLNLKNHYAASKVLCETLLRHYSENTFHVNVIESLISLVSVNQRNT